MLPQILISKFEFWRPWRSEQGSLAAVPQHEKDKQKKNSAPTTPQPVFIEIRNFPNYGNS